MIPSPPRMRRVALVGNPNAGKTTLFNSLTGSRQKVANYPGVTVDRTTGRLRGTDDVEIADIPGLYSLRAVSEDERVAVEEIENAADLLVVAVDATNLERNLFLVTQLAERRIPLLIVLTMADRLRAEGGELDLARLSNLLGCEVVAVDGRKDEAALPIAAAIERNLAHPRLP
ncbi:MAG: ferrous iron transport protein B, partial [Armatimonadota bacterium]